MTLQIKELKHDVIDPDPRNPRQIFDEEQLVELANDISVNGLLQPIVVRPHPKSDGRYMIVFGERRWRAASMIDMALMPCIVRELDDLAVLEVQISENNKRADVHPLEEADAYRRLHEEHGREVDEMVELCGKTKSYIYAAMKLCALTKEPRRAFLENRFDKSIALLIARLTEDVQPKATKEILHNFGRVMSYREARDHIQRVYMLELGRAPFNINDAGLVPAAGACGPCDKRTGSQPDLFADVCSEKGGGNRCTDPACFQAKSDEHWKGQKEKFKADGKEVIEGKAAQNAGSYNDKKYADINDHCVEAGKSYKELFGRKSDQAVSAIARTERGNLRELVERKKLPELLKAAGVKPSKSTSGPTPKEKEKKQEERRRLAVESAVVARVHQEVITKASGEFAATDINVWRLMARFAIRSHSGFGSAFLEKVATRRCGSLMQVLVNDDNEEPSPATERLMRLADGTDSAGDLRALVFELLLGDVRDNIWEIEPDESAPKKSARADYAAYRAEEQSNMLDALDVLDVDVKALTKEAAKAFEAAEQQKAADKQVAKGTKKGIKNVVALGHASGCSKATFIFSRGHGDGSGDGVSYSPTGSRTVTGAGYRSGAVECPECKGKPVEAAAAEQKAAAKKAPKPKKEKPATEPAPAAEVAP